MRKKYRIWTQEEKDFLTNSYIKIPTIDIAIKLNRTKLSITNMVRRLKVCRKFPTGWDQTMKQMLDDGYCQMDVAKAVGVSVSCVKAHRRKLGLLITFPTERTRKKYAENLKSQMRMQGYKSFSEYKIETQRYKAACQWPMCENQTEVEICKFLCERGKIIRKNIVEHLGKASSYVSKLLKRLKEKGIIQMSSREGLVYYYNVKGNSVGN